MRHKNRELGELIHFWKTRNLTEDCERAHIVSLTVLCQVSSRLRRRNQLAGDKQLRKLEQTTAKHKCS